MAGRFINTDRSGILMRHEINDTINNLVQDILQNPYYLFNDKRATKCTYYNLNTTMTTLDESTRGNYGEISPESPLRFNKINNFYIYGFSKVEPNLDVNEYGLESNDISGEIIVLPFTIVPYPGDFFKIDAIDGPLLFKVTAVNPNMLDTGAIMYKVNYALSSSDGIENIEPQVVKIYNFLVDNIGTNFATLMEESDYNNAAEIEKTITALQDYYISLFYNNKIQSFSFDYSNNGTIGGSEPNRFGYNEFYGFKIYDPYLIEFMIRNDILKGSSNYICVQHQYIIPNTFAVDYNRTFFKTLEDNDLSDHVGTYVGHYIRCEQRLSLLYAYPIDYYIMDYRKIDRRFYMINIFDDPEFSDIIKSGKLINNKKQIMKNIIIKYFNNIDIDSDDLINLKHIDYLPNKDLFYLIPFTIFILRKQLENMLS